MTAIHTIGRYLLIYYGKQPSTAYPVAQIILYDPQNELLGGMSFYKEGQPIPDNYELTNVTSIQVYLMANEKQLPGIVDMLWTEKPCSVIYNTPTSVQIYTGTEPIGEEET